MPKYPLHHDPFGLLPSIVDWSRIISLQIPSPQQHCGITTLITICFKKIIFTLSPLITLLAFSTAGAADDARAEVLNTEFSAVATAGKMNPLKNPYSILVALAFKQKIEGGPANYAEAATFYCRESRSGNANAQYAMGWLYAKGRGVEKNDYIAKEMLSKAAAQGHERAKELLAKIDPPSNVSEMPSCLLPDPPPAMAVKDEIFEPNISVETAALFNSQRRIYSLVEKLAEHYEIDANLAMTFIAVESGFNPQATSPKNARGLMQLIPETAERFRVKNAYNPEDNIKGGLAYLQWLLSFYQGDIELVAAAYNAGERAVERHKGIPPYPETQNYVKKITKLYRSRSHPYRDDVVKPSLIVTRY